MAENKIQEKVDEMATINFSITKCPMKIHKRFVEFCKSETSDNYSMGLKLLLDGMEGNAKEATLFQQYMELKEEVAMLKRDVSKLNPLKQMESKKPKTFGSGSDKNEQTD